MVTIYADVLVSVNILITYIFLVCVRVALNTPTNKLLVILASFIGGVSSIVIFFEEGSIFLNILYKVLVCGVITAVAFMPDSLRRFIRLFGAFSGVSVLFGGAVYLVYITLKPHNIYFNNGAVYFDMSVTYLIGVVFSVYGVFMMFEWFLLRRSAARDTYKVIITLRACEVELNGYVDTGNFLRDGLSGSPVFVVGLKDVSALFSYDEIVFLKGEGIGTPPDSLKSCYRVLPCTTVTGKGLIPAFTPHRVVVTDGERKAEVGKAVIGISGEITDEGQGSILLNKSIYDLDWEETENGKSIIEKIIHLKK